MDRKEIETLPLFYLVHYRLVNIALLLDLIFKYFGALFKKNNLMNTNFFILCFRKENWFLILIMEKETQARRGRTDLLHLLLLFWSFLIDVTPLIKLLNNLKLFKLPLPFMEYQNLLQISLWFATLAELSDSRVWTSSFLMKLSRVVEVLF